MADSLETARVETKAALDQALKQREERRRKEDQEIETLEMELRGLDLAIARRTGQPKMGDALERLSSALDASQWKPMQRTNAIVRVLREHGKPAGPAEIARLLNEKGRDQDNPTLVGASLDHLKNQGRARAVSRGQWVATAPQSDSYLGTDDDEEGAA